MSLSLIDLLLVLLLAGICGALGQAISGFSRGGCFLSIVLGFVGALLGVILQRALQAPDLFSIQIGDNRFPVVWSVIGSTLFVAVIGFLTSRRR